MKPRRALDACRAALDRGPLLKHRPVERGTSGVLYVIVRNVRVLVNDPDTGQFRYVRREVLGRAFSAQTVRTLIDAGEARRDGDKVVKA